MSPDHTVLASMTGAELWTCEEEGLMSGDDLTVTLARAEIRRRAAMLDGPGAGDASPPSSTRLTAAPSA